VKAEAVMTQFPVAGQITARACHIAAECYRTRGEPKKALEYYEKIVSNWPDYENAPEAQFMIARTFEQLKRAKAIPEADANATIRSAYERLTALYPNSLAAKAARQCLTTYKNQGGQP